MAKGNLVRFYLPSVQNFLYPDSIFCVKDGDGNRHFFINGNEPISSVDEDYVPQDFTGTVAVNGDLYVGDIVTYEGNPYRVVSLEDEDGNIVYSLSELSSNSRIPMPDGDKLEITGDVFSDENFSIDSYFNNEVEYEKTVEEEPERKNVDYSVLENNDESIFQDNLSLPIEDNNAEDFLTEDDDFLWEYDPADLLDAAYVKTFKNKENIFIKTLLDRANNRSAYGIYLRRAEDLVINGSYDECDKKMIELIALDTALSEVQEPSLIRLYLDNGFLKNLINNPETLDLNEKVSYLYNKVKPQLDKHLFYFTLENKINPTVESVIAKESAKEVL